MSYERDSNTPAIDGIWSREATIGQWLKLWIKHLQVQVEINPNHPGKADLDKYRQAAELYDKDRSYCDQFLKAVDVEEALTQHDLVAALNVFNATAGAHTAHMGLTSHDIVDAATEHNTRTSMQYVRDHVRAVVHELAHQAHGTMELTVIARTHGQPAQAMPYSMRLATIIDPLLAWLDRVDIWLRARPTRPPYGAVGTGADVYRVLTGWGHNPSPYSDLLHRYARLVNGTDGRMTMLHGAVRQVYHRSSDLQVAGLLAELGSIAHTWANDRRLETLLGHGYEARSVTQVGSSAMPHKVNAVRAERICGLARMINGYLSTAAEMASGEWLEGDVSGSAARRAWLPGIFRATSQVLTNWTQALSVWQLDRDAIRADYRQHMALACTGAAMHALVESGVPRGEAHQMVAQAAAQSPANSVGMARVINVDPDSWDLCLGAIRAHVQLVIGRASKV